MKKIIFIILTLLIPEYFYGQVLNYYYLTPEQLKENLNYGKIKECNTIRIDFERMKFGFGSTHFHGDNIMVNCVIYTDFIKNGDKLILTDKKLQNKYVFELNDSSIVSLKSNKNFNKGDKFFICEISNLNSTYKYDFRAYFKFEDLLYSSYWKDGIKKGIFFNYKKPDIMYLYYKNNKLVDSLIIKNEIDNDSIIDVFFEKYYQPKLLKQRK